MNVSGTRRSRALSRSRSLLIGAAVLILILVAQMLTTVVGAVVAQQQSEAATKDTFSYVGDLTAERIARFAASAEGVVDATSSAIAEADDSSLDEVARVMYLNLDRVPQVRGSYVGFPDGRFVSVSHDGSGYTSRIVEVDPTYRATQTTYDADFTALATQELDLRYDPRDRPWYQAGQGALASVWTQPYLVFGSDVTLASVAQAVRGPQGFVGVTGADVDVAQMASVLDNLPLGDGAEAFVLAPDRHVIAAPSAYNEQLRAIAGLTGEVPTAADIGISSDATAESYSDGNVFGHTDGKITLERGFPPREGLDWILRLEAVESELSPGLDRLQLTIFSITALSALMVVAVAVLMYRMWRPLRRLSVRARTDQLTGLANRHEFRARGAALLRRAELRDELVVVVALDMDRFKELNDELGHDAGDTALTLVGNALLSSSRDSDVVARLGGDEFVLMQIVSDAQSVPDVVERVREVVEHTVQTQAPGGEYVGLTAGYSLSRPGMFDLDVLMSEADSALIAGKRTKRGASHLYVRHSEANE